MMRYVQDPRLNPIQASCEDTDTNVTFNYNAFILELQ